MFFGCILSYLNDHKTPKIATSQVDFVININFIAQQVQRDPSVNLSLPSFRPVLGRDEKCAGVLPLNNL
jgi:hypothetical protein